MAAPTREEVHRLLSLTEKELLNEIGREVPVVFLPPPRIPKPWEIAEGWLAQSEVLLYGKLCIRERLCETLASPGFGDSVTLVLVVGDILSSVLVGVPPFTLAALLVKRGIRSFCHCGKEIAVERRSRLVAAAENLKLMWSHYLSDVHSDDFDEAKAQRFRDWLPIVEDVVRALAMRKRGSQQSLAADGEDAAAEG